MILCQQYILCEEHDVVIIVTQYLHIRVAVIC